MIMQFIIIASGATWQILLSTEVTELSMWGSNATFVSNYFDHLLLLLYSLPVYKIWQL